MFDRSFTFFDSSKSSQGFYETLRVKHESIDLSHCGSSKLGCNSYCIILQNSSDENCEVGIFLCLKLTIKTPEQHQ